MKNSGTSSLLQIGWVLILGLSFCWPAKTIFSLEKEKPAESRSAESNPESKKAELSSLEKIYGKCEFKNCGKGGPLPSLQALCSSLSKQEPRRNPQCNLDYGTKKPRTTGLIQQASLFTLTLDWGQTYYFLALRTSRGWYSMGELGLVSDPGAGGVSGDSSIDTFEFLPLIPGGQDELLLEYTFSASDIDQGINRVSTSSIRTNLICGAQGETPFCTLRIPVAALLKGSKLDSTQIEEREMLAKYPVYAEGLRLKISFDPIQGTVTLATDPEAFRKDYLKSLKDGIKTIQDQYKGNPGELKKAMRQVQVPLKEKIPQEWEPFLGTHPLLDLPRT